MCTLTPVGLAGGMNLYGFASGDPVNFSDPFGLCPDPQNPVCTTHGLILTGAMSGFLAAGSSGKNAQWGFAINLGTGDAMAFLTTGSSTGLGASVGPGFLVQRGSFDGLVSETGQGGGRSGSASSPAVTVTFSADDNGKTTGAGLSVGPGLGYGINSVGSAHGSGTVNLLAPVDAAKAGIKSLSEQAKDFANQASRAMRCPNSCRP